MVTGVVNHEAILSGLAGCIEIELKSYAVELENELTKIYTERLRKERREIVARQALLIESHVSMQRMGQDLVITIKDDTRE